MVIVSPDYIRDAGNHISFIKILDDFLPCSFWKSLMEDNNFGSDKSATGSRVRRGHWTLEEDEKLMQLVLKNGARDWNTIADSIEGRTGNSCRLRWFNQLNPRIKKGPFSSEEEDRLIEAHNMFGNKWSTIASLFPGRTDNTLKNHYRVVIARKRREEMKSPGPIRASSYLQRPSQSRFPNSLRNSGQFRGYEAPYLFQYPAALSTSWNNSLWKTSNSGYAVQAPSNSSSLKFSRMTTEAIGPVQHGNCMFPPKASSNGVNSWTARGSSCLFPEPNSYHSTGFLRLGIGQETPAVGNNHSLFMGSGSGNEKIGEGSCSVHKNAAPFIDFMGVGQGDK